MDSRKALVETAEGHIKGIQRAGLFEFKGIPFAAPPVGRLRWLPPEPYPPWQGVLEAVNFKPIAPQNIRENGLTQLPGFEAAEPQNEDCLYLNIWTPGLDKAKRPVLVWIYGGAFTSGSGSQPAYWGDILAARGNAVMVSFNYRLGLLGFLNLNVATGGKIPSTGNEGLLDQMAALHWVKDNISAFGGDSDNITVFGESSGAMSIGCLLGMPKARGLFHKAILESGTAKMARPLSLAVQTSQQFLQLTGLKSQDVQGLRSLTVSRLLAIQQELTLKAPGGITPVAPVIDGVVIPQKPLDSVRKGTGVSVPILIGNNLDENKISYPRQPEIKKMDRETLIKLCRTVIPSADVLRFIEVYQKARAGRGQPTEPHEIFSAIRGDAMFRVPAVRLAQANCENGQAAFNYLFTWKSPALGGLLGACHALEIGFVFGRRNPQFCGSGPQVDYLSDQIQDAWLAFARGGNPTCPSLGEWPQYCDARKTMILDANSHVEESVYEPERQVWDSIGEEDPVV